MAGSDVAEPKVKGKPQVKGRRPGVRIDMTPLVDVAFLLLTFFMYTTSMTRPQTMEINLPPEGKVTEVGDSKLLTLRVNSQGAIFWNFSMDAPKRIGYRDLRDFLKEQKAARPGMVTVLKIDRTGQYGILIDLLDELNLANIDRFSIAPFLEKDKSLVAGVQA